MNRTLQPAHPTEAVKRPGRWLALSVLVLAVLLVAVDATVLGLATPYISEDLAPSGTQLLWIGDVYSFVIAGLLVSMGTSATASDASASCSSAPRRSARYPSSTPTRTHPR